MDIGQVLFMDETKSRSINTQKKGKYPAILTEQAWSIKDLLYRIKPHNMINVPCGT